MPKKARSTFPTTTTTTLALSSIHIRLEAIEKEHQWLLKQIKRKQTELNNFVEQMRSLATDIFHRASPSFKKLAELDKEIHSLFNEIFNTRKFGKKTKKDIEEIYRNLQMAGIISPKLSNNEDDEELDELFEVDETDSAYSRSHEEENYQYQETQQEIDFSSGAKTESSRNVRQAFLRLAEIFHPDKVTDGETQMRHTEIMKEINKAYQEGDLARLLEIERKHLAGESVESNSEDDLTRKCTRLEQENEFLKTQYENLKRELRLVKHSSEGAMVSDCRKAHREGIDPIGQMLEQVESEIEVISDIRNFVKDFREQKISVKEFLCGPAALRQRKQEMMEDLLDQMFEDLERIVIF
ncbi:MULTISPECIES: J domain-containing protein [Nostocales]|uniref:J domain-containing protein n=2 Tax=Nostocales TaxID=1161 RepID=A0A0C1REA7_9CYAN|nr:J domain-containing protein [Tolypothrix bouteillei]KAF3886522.1 J domain-containing protein [Tolypothrix bouteillei VB521301]